MPVSPVTPYTYVTFYCNYFQSQWSSAVYSILLVGTFIVMTVLSVLYFSMYDGKKSKRYMRSINIVLFTSCVVFTVVHTSLCNTKRHVLCPSFWAFGAV